jgi:hypothetical protein
LIPGDRLLQAFFNLTPGIISSQELNVLSQVPITIVALFTVFIIMTIFVAPAITNFSIYSDPNHSSPLICMKIPITIGLVD